MTEEKKLLYPYWWTIALFILVGFILVGSWIGDISSGSESAYKIESIKELETDVGVIEKKQICTAECSQSTCDGIYFVDCLVGKDGCKEKQAKEKMIGKCGVECLKDFDCSSDEICSSNRCEENKKCPQFVDLKHKYPEKLWYDTYADASSTQYDTYVNATSTKDVDGWKIGGGYWSSWEGVFTYCRKGSKNGENINYNYCGESRMAPLFAIKRITDSSGVIKETFTKEIIIVTDSEGKFVETICK